MQSLSKRAFQQWPRSINMSVRLPLRSTPTHNKQFAIMSRFCYDTLFLLNYSKTTGNGLRFTEFFQFE